MILAVIFDFDGVIAESNDVKTAAFRVLFADQPPAAVERLIAFHRVHGGTSRQEKIRMFFEDILGQKPSKEELASRAERFSSLVMENVVTAPEVRGAREFLERNHVRYSFAIVSGTPTGELLEIVRRRGMQHLFKLVLGSPERKPALIRRVLAAAACSPSDAVFVGDSIDDFKAAQETGVNFVGRRTPDNVADFKACRWLLDDLSSLETVLAEIDTIGARWAGQ